MLAFLDESGDPGFKPAQGSSRYFFVALVAFDDDEDAHLADQRIDRLRQELRMHPRQEFKFNKLSSERRLAFLQAVNRYDFHYHGVVIDKGRLHISDFKLKDPFFRYVSRIVFTDAQSYLRQAPVVIDGSGSREFRRGLSSYLRGLTNEEREVIRRVKIQDSQRNNLLQLADMTVGALARSHGEKRDAADYRAVIRRHEAGVQVWPP